MKLALIVGLLSASALRAGIPVWIDTDPSVARGGHEVDDGFALIQAFRSPALSVRGVSVVFGNAPLVNAFPIGQRLVREFGSSGMPVYRGAVSGNDLGLETEASRALEAALAKEELIVIALGPVTNVATVLRNHPELARRVKQIVAVAGRRPQQRFVTQATARPFRDFNFELDAPAFQVLLDSNVPLVLAPWEVSSKVWLGEQDLSTLRSKDAALSWVLDAAADWLQFWRKNLGTQGFNPFDTLAVGYVISSVGFHCEQLPAAIQRLPDDTVPQNAASTPEKPYLLVDRKLASKTPVLYCFDPPPDFSAALVRQLTVPVPTLDHSLWNALAQKYINAEAKVDYAAIQAEALPRLDAYLRLLGAKWPNGLPAADKKAALLNAYNALTVRWIITNYPVQSIWRTKHPFTEARHSIDGELVSLDRIESQLRDLSDPRIHAALVCAARGCPPLRREAYEARRLDEQLDDNVRSWLANPRLNEFVPERKTASVSMIFKWYANDFIKTSGSVENFLSRFVPSETGDRLEYKTYDWGLNDRSNIGDGYSQAKFYWDALRNK